MDLRRLVKRVLREIFLGCHCVSYLRQQVSLKDSSAFHSEAERLFLHSFMSLCSF